MKKVEKCVQTSTLKVKGQRMNMKNSVKREEKRLAKRHVSRISLHIS